MDHSVDMPYQDTKLLRLCGGFEELGSSTEKLNVELGTNLLPVSDGSYYYIASVFFQLGYTYIHINCGTQDASPPICHAYTPAYLVMDSS